MPCHEEGLTQVINYLHLEWEVDRTEALIHFNKARSWVHYQLKGTAASHHRLLYMSKLCEFVNKNPVRFSRSLEAIYWEGYFSKMVLDKNSIPLLTELQKSGLKLGLVTDLVAEIQYRKLNHLGLDDFFQVVTTSEEAGIEKPAKAIFQLTMDKLALSSSRDAVMVGDSYSKDILGANSFGMKAYWVKGDPTKASDWVLPVQDLGELRGKILKYD